MTRLPFLADEFHVRHTPVASLRKAALDGFGWLAVQVKEAGPKLLDFPPDMPQRWSDLVAAELLLSRWIHGTVEEQLVERFGEAFPFGPRGPALREAMESTGACAVIPMSSADPEEEPPTAVVWVVADRRDRLGPEDDRLPDPEHPEWKTWILVGTDADDVAIEGKSWTLAAALARRAAVETNDGGELRKMLATDWLLTGWVNGKGEVREVVVGNKVNVRTSRQWLFPEENRKDLIGYADRLDRVRFADSETAAWARVTGRGVFHAGEIAWPERVGVLHSFVSLAREPVIAAALLSGARKVVLWHSDEQRSRESAQEVREVLESLSRHQSLSMRLSGWVSSRRISSSDLAEARKTLDKGLEDDLASGETVLFNVTQGNRLMGFAPLTLAQLHPRLWLVYRDIDAPAFQFTVIRYESLQPVTQVTPAVAPAVPWSVHWEVLFRPPAAPGNRPTAQELCEMLCLRPERGDVGSLLPAES